MTANVGSDLPGLVDFTDLDIFATRGVPHEMLTTLRAREPVYWHPTLGGGGFWLLSKHDDVVRVSRDWQLFSSEMAHGGIVGLDDRERQVREGNSTENSLITMDPPIHGKYRRFVSNALLPSAVVKVGKHVRTVSAKLIDSAIQKQGIDFVEDIAAWVPLEALAELGNIPISDRKQMFDWVNTIVGPDDPEFAATPQQLMEVGKALRQYCYDLYETRSRNIGEDIISMMIKGEVDGESVAADRAAAFFELLLSAGSETTRTAMTHGIMALAQFPDQYEIMRRDSEVVRMTAIEEVLRWASPVIYFRRGVTADTEIRGKKIKTGDSVMICFSSANRDEEVFENPFVFDVTRKSNPHLAFGGRGPHNCLGANLARMELKIFFEELCKKVLKITLTGEPDYLRSNLTNGIKHLPIRLEAA